MRNQEYDDVLNKIIFILHYLYRRPKITALHMCVSYSCQFPKLGKKHDGILNVSDAVTIELKKKR